MAVTSSAFGRDPMPDILLVEDNALHIRLVKSMLADVWPEPNGLRTARKLSSAITEVRASRPDCVLLDLVLPDAEGLQAVKALLAVDDSVPIVVLSSHEDDEMALQAVKEGAQDYLVKGTVGPDALARAVEFAMQRQKMDREPDPEAVPAVAPAAPAGLVVLDAGGAITHAQTAVAEMLGVDVENLVGAAVGTLTHPNDVSRWPGGPGEESGTEDEFTARLRHASGNDVGFRVELTSLAGVGGSKAYLARLYPKPEEGTQSSGGHYAVVSEWVGG